MKRTCFVILGLVAAVGACSASEPAAPGEGAEPGGAAGGGAGGSAGSRPPGPHAICEGEEPGALPAGFGTACDPKSIARGCSYATNQCDTTLCFVDDGDPGVRTGYCASACSGPDDASCPPGHTCKESTCATGAAKYVCQAAPPSRPSSCARLATVDPGLAGIDGLAVTKSQRIFVIGQDRDFAPVVAARDPSSGAWSRIARFPDVLGLEYLQRWAVGETAFFAEDRKDYPTRFFVATTSGVTIESLTTCSGDACPHALTGFAHEGAARVMARTNLGAWSTWERDPKGSWSKLADLDVTFDQEADVVPGVTALADRGLLGACRRPDAASSDLCTSLDGVKWDVVPLPAGEKVPKVVVPAVGASPDDFFVTFASGTTWHRAGDAFYREGLPAAIDEASGYPWAASLWRTNDGTVFASLERSDKSGRYEYLLDEGGCWKAFGARARAAVIDGVPFGDDRMVRVENVDRGEQSDTLVCISAPR